MQNNSNATVLQNGVTLHSYLSELGEPFRYRSGEVLWEQGEQASWLLVVNTGVLKLQRNWPSGSHTILDLLYRNSVVGEEIALVDATRNATCTAITQGKAFRVNRSQISTAALRRDVSIGLFQISTNRLQTMISRMEELFDGPVELRLANTLLRLSENMGIPNGKGVFIPVRLTRGELAELIGCRAETTTRLMTKWKRAGVVDTKREGIVIEDIEALRQLATPS